MDEADRAMAKRLNDVLVPAIARVLSECKASPLEVLGVALSFLIGMAKAAGIPQEMLFLSIQDNWNQELRSFDGLGDPSVKKEAS